MTGLPPASRGATAIWGHIERTDGVAVEEWYHPRPSRAFSGPGPVEAVSLQRLDDPPHWHLVTYGLTELRAKESGDRHISGWGFELTFRLEWSDEVPLWAVDFLASLAAYVWSSRHPFAEGHLMDLRGPIRMGHDTPITAALIIEDPVLRSLDGPFGSLQFLQVVGVAAEELELCRSWNAEGVVELLARDDPLLVTRLDRPSVASDPRWAAEIAERIERDGSSLHELRIGTLQVRHRVRGRAQVQMGAGAAAALGPALRRELLGEGATFTVVGDDSELRFVVGSAPGWRWTDEGIEGELTMDSVEYVAGLFDGRPGWGRVSDWEGLRFRVVK